MNLYYACVCERVNLYYVCVCVHQKSTFHAYFFICVHVLNLHANSVIIISLFQCTDCVPQCKFGACNTTIGECICPPRHSGADCSVISMVYC